MHIVFQKKHVTEWAFSKLLVEILNFHTWSQNQTTILSQILSIKAFRKHASCLLYVSCDSRNAAVCWSQINRFIHPVPSPPLSFPCPPRGPLVGFVWEHTLLCSSICCSMTLWMDVGSFRLWAGSFVCSGLIEALRWCKCLMVLWSLWRVLWWIVMQCFPMVPELHHNLWVVFGKGV